METSNEKLIDQIVYDWNCEQPAQDTLLMTTEVWDYDSSYLKKSYMDHDREVFYTEIVEAVRASLSIFDQTICSHSGLITLR